MSNRNFQSSLAQSGDKTLLIMGGEKHGRRINQEIDN